MQIITFIQFNISCRVTHHSSIWYVVYLIYQISGLAQKQDNLLYYEYFDLSLSHVEMC